MIRSIADLRDDVFHLELLRGNPIHEKSKEGNGPGSQIHPSRLSERWHGRCLIADKAVGERKNRVHGDSCVLRLRLDQIFDL